ncbi:response regulator [Halobacteriovorax sp. HLS]|uniref:response regulator n=1 Tax=Halobacteriovorax sp. HLS TaxID=2234000 RepID=UPI000FDB05F5|nr:response regulator [Halobacteriovorax sp. HLS]
MINYNILIAEDNTDFVELLRERIKGFDENISISEASNGYNALDKLKSFQYDLLITDFHMPVMNGMELIKSIKSIPEKNRPRNVIMLSAFLEAGEPAEDLSFVRFLPKDDFKDSLFELISESRAKDEKPSRKDQRRVGFNSNDNENIRIDIVGKNFVDIVKGKDISLGGIAVKVPHFIIDCKIGENVECIISLPQKKTIKTFGTVRHVGEENDFYFGIEFTKMDKLSEKNLKEFVESKR